MNSKHFIFYLIVAFFIYWLITPFYPTFDTEKEIENEIVEIVDSTTSVMFSAVGDIMCHSTQYNYAWVEGDSFDFNPVFSVIGNYLENKDVLIGNLETVLAGDTKNYLGYPFFNTPNSLAKALRNTGFDYLTTANNHANDQGVDGIERTYNVLKKNGMVPLGTAVSDSFLTSKIYVKNGLRFGILAYTYGTNYNPSSLKPKKYVKYIDTLKIKRDIDSLRKKNAELVIVYFHFGNEYQKQISDYQKKVVESTINSGADIILGAHPHIIQQFERFSTNNATLDTGFVAYSLGNFISNQRWRYSDGGVIFNFEITKNIYTDSIYITDINYLPIWLFKGKTENGRDYIVIPSSDSTSINNYEYLTKADIDSMHKSYYDTIDQLTSKSGYPKIDRLEKFN